MSVRHFAQNGPLTTRRFVGYSECSLGLWSRFVSDLDTRVGTLDVAVPSCMEDRFSGVVARAPPASLSYRVPRLHVRTGLVVDVLVIKRVCVGTHYVGGGTPTGDPQEPGERVSVVGVKRDHQAGGG